MKQTIFCRNRSPLFTNKVRRGKGKTEERKEKKKEEKMTLCFPKVKQKIHRKKKIIFFCYCYSLSLKFYEKLPRYFLSNKCSEMFLFCSLAAS